MSSGFLIRAIAGGVAADIPLSQWFLLVMAFGSLFMAAGKRYAELQLAERTGAKIRKSLESYTSTYLRFVWTLSATAVVICYGLWAFERDGSAGSLVRGVDGPVHHRDPALRGGRRRRTGRRTRGDRAARPGAAAAGAGLDRNRRCRCLPSASTGSRRRWPARRCDAAARPVVPVSDVGPASACGSACVVVAALFGWGAWQRRWIADDGLIVLRTVRNLLAGNGPVFNAGERVEANTSTVWTYLMYLGGWVGGPVRLEYVALTLALMLVRAGRGAADARRRPGCTRPSLQGRRALLLPAGALVYIAIPPARDFATSGLENGLVLAYLGLAVVDDGVLVAGACGRPGAGASGPNAVARFTAALAFVAGLSVLVRPELALIGGLALVMMLVAARGWRRRAADRGRRRAAAGRLPDLPDGLLRPAGARAPRWPRTPPATSGRRA